MRETVVSVTGTRHGVVGRQLESFERLLRVLFGKGTRTLAHGCCHGVDETAALLGRDLAMHVVAHPGDLPAWTSAIALEASHDVMPAQSNKNRNAALVRAAGFEGFLVGCPAGAEAEASQRRSGTWQTVRMARQSAIALALVMPDGSLSVENWPG